MKSFSDRIIEFINSIFSQKKLTPSVVRIVAILLLTSGLSRTISAQQCATNANYYPPTWAPAYNDINQVQYYYFPDIESYYDVYNREFVYLEHGDWVFAPQLPFRYNWFDINNSFSVLLDFNTFDPWRYHNYYVEQYPRYYYRNTYRHEFENREHFARGFNENSRGLVYNSRNERREYIDRHEMNERREFAQRHEVNERREATQRHEMNENSFNNNRPQRFEPTHTPQRSEVVNTPRFEPAHAPQRPEVNNTQPRFEPAHAPQKTEVVNTPRFEPSHAPQRQEVNNTQPRFEPVRFNKNAGQTVKVENNDRRERDNYVRREK